jgi:hypothetical protein
LSKKDEVAKKEEFGFEIQVFKIGRQKAKTLCELQLGEFF